MGKKAQMMMSPGKSVCFIFGFLLLVIGGLQLLIKFNIVKFTIPAVVSLIFAFILLASVLALFYAGFSLGMGMPGPSTYFMGFIGLLLVPLGLIPVLNYFKILAFVLPAIIVLTIAPFVIVGAALALFVAGMMIM